MAELDREPPSEVGRARVGRGLGARPGRARLALAGRCRQPLGRACVLPARPALGAAVQAVAARAARRVGPDDARRGGRRLPAAIGSAGPRRVAGRGHVRGLRAPTGWRSGATPPASSPRARSSARASAPTRMRCAVSGPRRAKSPSSTPRATCSKRSPKAGYSERSGCWPSGGSYCFAVYGRLEVRSSGSNERSRRARSPQVSRSPSTACSTSTCTCRRTPSFSPL